jgi:oligopeptide transport system substrate-binding protein
VEAVAPLSLRVELEDPQPYLPEILASPRLAPVSAGLAGAGAYAVSSWERRQRIVLTLNPHHPWRRPEAAQTVVVRPATSEDSALAWFESGQADVVMGLVPAGRTRELQSRLGRQLVKAPMRSEFYFMFNLSRPDALALDARRVFAAAMDREGLVGQVLAGGQVPAYGYVPDAYGDSGPGNLRCPGFAAGHARAGHAAGSRPLELMSNGSETLKTILEFTEQSLKAAGFSVTLRLMEWKTFLGLVQGGDFDVARYSLTGGPDPIDFFENFTTGHPNNVGRFSLSAYDALVAEARGAADRADRNRILARAHALLCDALPAVPVYFSSQLYLVRESLVDRFRPDPEGVANWDRL